MFYFEIKKYIKYNNFNKPITLLVLSKNIFICRANDIVRYKTYYFMYITLLFFRILQLLNRRDLERLKEKWWNKNPDRKDCEKVDDQSDGISIQNIGGVFIVIFVGIGLACITLAFEYWWYKYKKGINVIDVTRQSEFPSNLGFMKGNKLGKVKDKNPSPHSLFPRSRF